MPNPAGKEGGLEGPLNKATSTPETGVTPRQGVQTEGTQGSCTLRNVSGDFFFF